MSLTHEELPIDFDPRWIEVLKRMKDQFGKKPELETILFLIGINELGKVEEKFTKEQKQDLMHVAVCRLLSFDGYYRLAGWDDDHWPMWEAAKELPPWSAGEQEEVIKKNIIRYFEENNLV
jgi:hypothetical protein